MYMCVCVCLCVHDLIPWYASMEGGMCVCMYVGVHMETRYIYGGMHVYVCVCVLVCA